MQTYVPATVLTGMGTLTVTGSVSVAANTNTFFVPVINGMLISATRQSDDQRRAQRGVAATRSACIELGPDAQRLASTPLTITGSGIVAIGGQSQYANATNVANGTTLAFGSNRRGDRQFAGEPRRGNDPRCPRVSAARSARSPAAAR